MGAVWVACATAVELSDRTLRAAAKLTGAATLALMSDIAARSGSASPARPSSSSRVSLRYSCSLPTGLPPSGAHLGAKPNAVSRRELHRDRRRRRTLSSFPHWVLNQSPHLPGL